MGDLGLEAEKPGPLSRVTASRLDALPRGLAAALAERDALISEVRGSGKRVFVTADSSHGKLFARYSDDPADVPVFAHEAEVRRIVGTKGLLRAPVVLDEGEGWLLETAVASERIRGAHAVDTAAAAASRLIELRIPTGPRAHAAPDSATGRVQRRLRVAFSALPASDLSAAERILADPGLPPLPSHGDFFPENLLLAGGALWVVDWECSAERPAGYDLMQLWSALERAGDRERLFDSALELVGTPGRRKLEQLRYAVVVETAWRLLHQGDGARPRADGLLALLPQLRPDG
ncbi:MAG: Choline/ethanolamine kinase [Gaiellaceae bacterium]|nr:Choline/ethanolamine kinase [Gaiellaceae bacterium]